MATPRDRDGAIALAIGPLVALLAAGLLGQFRGDVGATNVVLVLAMIVVLAALAGRMAGIVTAITAAVAYNFFHTVPYHSLRISGAKDVVTVVLLAVLGLVVGEVAAFRRRAQASSSRRLHGAEALEATAAMLARRASIDELWPAIATALTDELELGEVRYEPGVTTSYSVLPRSGSLASASMHVAPGGFALPSEGVAIAVTDSGHTFGHIIMKPRPGSGSTIDSRRVAIALADLFAVAMLSSPGGPSVNTPFTNNERS